MSHLLVNQHRVVARALLALVLLLAWAVPVAAGTPAVSIAAVSITAASPVRQPSAPLVDADWYRDNLIRDADLWNGGLDGQSGFGAYRDDFDGFFHPNLDMRWLQGPMRGGTTAVAQSRAIYMNVEAYRIAGPDEGQRFLTALTLGIEFLLVNFKDPQYGGFYWEVRGDGRVVNDMKQGYGNVHPMFALAQAYAVTQNPDYLAAALEQLDVIQQRFADPDYPGGILSGFSRDFSTIIGVKNVDTFTHIFEPLLILYDVTEGEQREEIADLIVLYGNFLVDQLYNDQEGYSDRGYVAYNYDEAWQPSTIPYTRENQWSGGAQASTGHNIELAYLLSRAVERGFNPEWLDVAQKLLNFCTEYALHPDYGGMIYEVTDYEGQPLEGNPDNSLFIWWAQAETARALLHFTLVRGGDYVDEFQQVESLLRDHLTDPENGGWFYYLDAEKNLEPVGWGKGDIWKTNYHKTMFYVEVLRLAELYPDQIEALAVN